MIYRLRINPQRGGGVSLPSPSLFSAASINFVPLHLPSHDVVEESLKLFAVSGIIIILSEEEAVVWSMSDPVGDADGRPVDGRTDGCTGQQEDQLVVGY